MNQMQKHWITKKHVGQCIKIICLCCALSTISVTSICIAETSPQNKKASNKENQKGTQKMESNFESLIKQTREMVSDKTIQSSLQSRGLSIQNISWEDTARFKDSSVGPNISDLTIQVQFIKDRETEFHAMPVIRYPNFDDLSADLNPDDFELFVGNEVQEGQSNKTLSRVSLSTFLHQPKQFLSFPKEWKSLVESLFHEERDKKVLVSAQACLVPVPSGKVTSFNPVLFNYQSFPGSPAVLTIMSTKDGTSVTTIENKENSSSHTFAGNANWGQKLFHNNGGKKSSFTAQRISDFVNAGTETSESLRPQDPNTKLSTALLQNLNRVYIIQVPLKVKPKPKRDSKKPDVRVFSFGGPEPTEELGSNVEQAVIGFGQTEGPYEEVINQAFERDTNFPIRVTVQFYLASNSGRLTQREMDSIKQNIDDVYKKGDAVSSLITQGNTGRPTEYWGNKVQPKNWWENFWSEYESAYGEKRAAAIKRLEKIIGKPVQEFPVTELYLRQLLHRPTPKN